MALSLDDDQLVKKGSKLGLGNLTKSNPRWWVGLGWDPAPGSVDVDCDLWLVALKGGEAIDLVHYDPNNPKAIVVSSETQSLTYNGDDRTGSSSDGGDDETGIIDLAKLNAVGGDKVLLIASIYEPGSMTFDQIKGAHMRIWPDGDESKQVGMNLTDMGVGARVVIFGWLEKDGDSWSFMNQPSHAPSIQAALMPFGIG